MIVKKISASCPPEAADQPDSFRVQFDLDLRDAQQLWRVAAAHALAVTGLCERDVEEMLGPITDPQIIDCLGLLLAPLALPGCAMRTLTITPLPHRRRVDHRRQRRVSDLASMRANSPLRRGD